MSRRRRSFSFRSASVSRCVLVPGRYRVTVRSGIYQLTSGFEVSTEYEDKRRIFQLNSSGPANTVGKRNQQNTRKKKEPL